MPYSTGTPFWFGRAYIPANFAATTLLLLPGLSAGILTFLLTCCVLPPDWRFCACLPAVIVRTDARFAAAPYRSCAAGVLR